MRNCFLAVILFSVGATAGETSSSKVPEEVKTALQSAQLNEGNMISGPSGSREILMDYMTKNWRQVLENLLQIAPGRSQRLVIYRACDGLEAKEFLGFLERLVDLSKQGTLKDDEYVQAMYFSSYKTGFLDLNIENERIQAIVRHSEEVYERLNIQFDRFSTDKIPEIKQRGVSMALSERRTLNPLKLSASSNERLLPDSKTEGNKAESGRPGAGGFATINSDNSVHLKVLLVIVLMSAAGAGWLLFQHHRKS